MIRWFAHLRIAVKVTVAPALAILGLIGLTAGAHAVFDSLRADFVYLNDIAFARFSDAVKLQGELNQAHGQLYLITSLANANDMQEALAHAKIEAPRSPTSSPTPRHCTCRPEPTPTAPTPRSRPTRKPPGKRWTWSASTPA